VYEIWIPKHEINYLSNWAVVNQEFWSTYKLLRYSNVQKCILWTWDYISQSMHWINRTLYWWMWGVVNLRWSLYVMDLCRTLWITTGFAPWLQRMCSRRSKGRGQPQESLTNNKFEFTLHPRVPDDLGQPSYCRGCSRHGEEGPTEWRRCDSRGCLC
jgi:hypothetical protein